MEGKCPRCLVRLDLPASGVYLCERCKARFEVAVGFPKPQPAPAAVSPMAFPGAPAYAGYPGYGPAASAPVAEPEVDPNLQAPCAVHPGNAASRVCERCGDFMCRLCTTPVEGRAYCPRCFDLLYNRGSLQFAQRQFTLPGVTLGLGLAAFFTSFFGCFFLFVSLPLGIGGIVAGVKAYKEYAARPELPNRGMTTTGVVFAAISVVITALWIGVMVWSMMRNP